MKKEIVIKFICKYCGNEYLMTEGEIKFFRDKTFPLPKSCPECRIKKKNELNSENYKNNNYTFYTDNFNNHNFSSRS
jgi:hypothetical protein